MQSPNSSTSPNPAILISVRSYRDAMAAFARLLDCISVISGIAIVARMPMMTTAISSGIGVKPVLFVEA